MREPPAGPFDAVMNLYSSFGYFEDPDDDVNCLRAWYRVLRPGGTLVLESMHRDRLAWLWGRESDPGTRRETGMTDWTTGVRTSYVQVDGETRMFQVRLYTATDLVGMMTETGFASIEVYGGLDGSPLDPSTRLAIRARR
jgi:SAM-dependent methyltransferase